MRVAAWLRLGHEARKRKQFDDMADPLVLLPDLMCDARLFGPQIAALSCDTAVMVAPLTQGERIEEIASGLLDQLPTRFALVGHGMGGAVAMELVRRSRDRVTRLGLMSTHPLPETPQIAAVREPQIVMARSGRLTEAVKMETLLGQLAPGGQRSDIAELLADMATYLGPEVYIRQARAMQRRRDQQQTLQTCKVPTLIMSGRHDAEYSVKRHEAMAEFIPKAHLAVFEGSGHFPSLEEPDEVIDAFREFLRMR